ncbi:hypothetical protein N7676_15940 [Stenotrophomonas sp. GD03993]|uniref:hypothetical protein n=1 Tax=unclassified Stenotrophomonas TaxID=196198 RepID=UPI0024481EF7|nr:MULTISPECIES: hypothetical protein [unclassified Stenotrophomonas]MDH0187677.1 hypothetical protein [Stenotrophomonas sp. GD04051]MDH0465298.1 hypothetical protein [Stenotrophomonas sp. GD03993]MDH0877857.1 hypothetical protein [Stenotrophomonas sp. GD03877]
MGTSIKIAVALAFTLALSACDKPSAPVPTGDAGAGVTKGQQQADQCYLGSVDACDAYKAETGEDLPYASGVRKKAAKEKTKGAEF